MERRELLKLLGALASLPLAGVRGAERPASGRARGAIGLQLYTVRSLMARDVEGTLAAVAEIGYREVELAGLEDVADRELGGGVGLVGIEHAGGVRG